MLVKRRLGLDPAEWRHFQLTMPEDDIGIDPDVCRIIAVSHYVKVSPAAAAAVRPSVQLTVCQEANSDGQGELIAPPSLKRPKTIRIPMPSMLGGVHWLTLYQLSP